MLLLLLPQAVLTSFKAKCPLILKRDEVDTGNHCKPGEFIIGGIVSATKADFEYLSFHNPPLNELFTRAATEHWKFLSFLFAIQGINKNPKISFNNSLGYNIYDNYFSAQITSEALLDLLSEGEANIPNYSCGRQRNTLVVLEEADTDISIQISAMLGIYKIPQISHSFISQILSDKTLLPFFYPMLPAEGVQYSGMVKLVVHFRWTLVGLLTPDTENGQRFMRILTSMLIRNGICPVLSQTFPPDLQKVFIDMYLYQNWTKVNIFIYGADMNTFQIGLLLMHHVFERLTAPLRGKVLITTTRWDFTISWAGDDFPTQCIHSIFSFLMKKKQMVKYDGYLKFESTMEVFAKNSFLCYYTKDAFSVKVWRRCKEKEELDAPRKEEIDQILTLDSYLIYNIVWAVGRAFNAAYLSRSRRTTFKNIKNFNIPMLKAWQVFLLYES